MRSHPPDYSTPLPSMTSSVYMRARPLLWTADDVVRDSRVHISAQQLQRQASLDAGFRVPESTTHAPMSQLRQLPPWRRPSVTNITFPLATDEVRTSLGREQTYRMPCGAPLSPTVAPPSYASPMHSHYADTHSHRSHMDPPPPYMPDDVSFRCSMPGGYPPSPTMEHATYQVPSHPPSPRRCARRTCGSLPHATSEEHLLSCCCQNCFSATPSSHPRHAFDHPLVPGCVASPIGQCHHATSATVHISCRCPSSSPSSSFPQAECCRAIQPQTTSRAYSSTRGSLSGVMHFSVPLPHGSSCHCTPQAWSSDWLTYKLASSFTRLLPFLILVPFVLYAIPTLSPSCSSSCSNRSSASQSWNSPLLWRALSGLLTYVFRVLKDVDVKM